MDADPVIPPVDPASPSPQARHIQLEGPLNFRDLGGYPARDGRTVRWRMIFRSDGLDTLSPADLALLVEKLGLNSVIDLRSGDELDRVGRGPVGETEIVLHHIPIFDETRRLTERFLGGRGMSDLYVQMIDTAGPRFVRALEVIARTDAPLVFHCAAGKDRTGLLGAVLLELLGVSDDDIAEDYAHSARVMPILRERWEARTAAAKAAAEAAVAQGRTPDDQDATGLPVLPGGEEGRRIAEEMLSARPATILALLDSIRQRFGSVSEWAATHGLAEADANRLRDRLLV